MLFDETVIEFVNQHFVPVIADHPMGKTEPKRNPKMWERCEGWKFSPNNGQLVWLVSADESRRSAIFYSKFEKPEAVLAWMKSIAVFDGRIEEPSDAQVRAAVLGNLRWSLKEIYAPLVRADRDLRKRSQAFDSVCDVVADEALCGKGEARAMLARLRQPSKERRAALHEVAGRLLGIAGGVDLGEQDWLEPMTAAHRSGALGGEAVHIALVATMRSWLGQQIASGRLEASEAVKAELDQLGARVQTVGAIGAAGAVAKGQTLAEFQEYAATRLSGISDAQLAELAKAVDADGDGVISPAEFEDRMEKVRTVLQGGGGDRQPVVSGAVVAAPAVAAAPAARIGGSSRATVLLITGSELVDAWGPFAEWKTRIGKACKIVTVDQIAKSYEADSLQEQIRLCVRDHIENHGTRWVVLGGDSLPGGKGLVPGGHTTTHAQERRGIPTDIVYLSATDWDADGDGVYGEWEDDRDAISYPDGSVGLGRVPVRTAADVAAFTQKVIEYESSYPADDFAKQMIYTCTDAPAYPKVRNSWDGYLSKVWDAEMGRFFSQETPWDEGEPGSHQLSSGNLVALINGKTTGKMHIHGHGMLPFWILEGSKFSAEHVARLDNAGAYPLITTVSCFTGQYDGDEDPSIVESMIRRPGGGSVAVVAPIRTGKPHFHNRSDFRLMVSEGKLDGTTLTMTRYWTGGLGGGLTTGEALMKAKDAMAEDARKTAGYHLCICELNLLGDPTLDMRASTPKRPELSAPETIAVGSHALEIGTGVAGATVCLWKGTEVYEIAGTDGKGVARFQIEAATAGELHVAVSGPSLNVATGVIAVVSGS